MVSRMEFHARKLVNEVPILERVPLYFSRLLSVRGLPAVVVYVRILALRQRAGLGNLQSTGIPLVVVITQIGLATHHMLPVNATDRVGAGMVPVLSFPLIGYEVAGKDAGPIGHGLLDLSDPARDSSERQLLLQLSPSGRLPGKRDERLLFERRKPLIIVAQAVGPRRVVGQVLQLVGISAVVVPLVVVVVEGTVDVEELATR
jgi:hypothetical protein